MNEDEWMEERRNSNRILTSWENLPAADRKPRKCMFCAEYRNKEHSYLFATHVQARNARFISPQHLIVEGLIHNYGKTHKWTARTLAELFPGCGDPSDPSVGCVICAIKTRESRHGPGLSDFAVQFHNNSDEHQFLLRYAAVNQVIPNDIRRVMKADKKAVEANAAKEPETAVSRNESHGSTSSTSGTVMKPSKSSRKDSTHKESTKPGGSAGSSKKSQQKLPLSDLDSSDPEDITKRPTKSKKTVVKKSKSTAVKSPSKKKSSPRKSPPSSSSKKGPGDDSKSRPSSQSPPWKP